MKLGASVVFAVLLLVPSTASAATSVSLLRAADGVRLEVKVTSKKPFKKATKPTGVKVTAGGATYKLKKFASTRKSSTWRSAPSAALEALGGQKVKLKITTKGKAKTTRPKVPALPALPAPPGPTPPTPPQLQLTRDDAAGQTALANAGDLLLEWYSFGSTGLTAEYRRIWLLTDGSFRINIVDWNSVSGESCRQAITGTWAFKEGYTTTVNGGGVVVKLAMTPFGGATADDIVVLSYTEPNRVWVGPQLTEYARNPQIMQNC